MARRSKDAAWWYVAMSRASAVNAAIVETVGIAVHAGIEGIAVREAIVAPTAVATGVEESLPLVHVHAVRPASDLGRLLLRRDVGVDRGNLWRDVQRQERRAHPPRAPRDHRQKAHSGFQIAPR